MRHILGIFLFFSISLPSWGSIIHCLAREESKFHKEGYKYRAHYLLNQTLMEEFLQLGSVRLQRITMNSVCSPNERYPSVRLLEHLINYQENTFLVSYSKLDVKINIKRSLINELIDRLPFIVHDFISHMQASCPTPHCLEENIPNLKDFYEKLKYTREHTTGENFIKEDNRGIQIIRNFQRIDQIIKKCQPNQRKKSPKDPAKS